MHTDQSEDQVDVNECPLVVDKWDPAILKLHRVETGRTIIPGCRRDRRTDQPRQYWTIGTDVDVSANRPVN